MPITGTSAKKPTLSLWKSVAGSMCLHGQWSENGKFSCLLAETGDVVVVTIKYRKGAFGFLYADGISPNPGLQDQVCALMRIRQHIRDFGGDPYPIRSVGGGKNE